MKQQLNQDINFIGYIFLGLKISSLQPKIWVNFILKSSSPDFLSKRRYHLKQAKTLLWIM
ncbi:hypothetical protein [Acinetobacter indicus]|uniref:hypothetical protein n=1 Tax=Acinetobacter indicus TaxID=756892 RepID=UPI0013151320|nr:hypothetical protein [Acinetobacter indicus]